MSLSTSNFPDGPTNNSQEKSNKKPGLGLLCGDERKRAWDVRRNNKGIRDYPKPIIENPSTDDEFLAMFGNLSVEDVDKLINFRLGITKQRQDGITAEDVPRNIEWEYKNGNTFCAALLPFSEMGRMRGQTIHDLSEDEWRRLVDNYALLRLLNVDSEDNLTDGFSDIAGYFYDLLPPLLKKDISEGGCSFKIEYPEAMVNHPANKVWFLERYKLALENLRSIIKSSPALGSGGSPN